MSQSAPQPPWWDLHLRKARGEVLSPAEEQFYEEAMAQLDREAPPLLMDLDALKQLRDQTRALERENAALRERLQELHREIRRAEQALSR